MLELQVTEFRLNCEIWFESKRFYGGLKNYHGEIHLACYCH